MTKCNNYYSYRAIFPPKCNKGNPCEACQKKYRNMQALRAEAKQVKPCEDCGTIKKSINSIRCKQCADIRADESKRMAELRNKYPDWYAKYDERIKSTERMVKGR